MTRLESFFIGLTAEIATGLILWPILYTLVFWCAEALCRAWDFICRAFGA